MLWWAVLLLVAVGVIYVIVLLRRERGEDEGIADTVLTIPVKSRKFMTETELKFLALLEQALPELRFHAQVSMGALLEPSVKQFQKGSGYHSIRNRFNRKMIDFVGQCRQQGHVIVVIELDDASHDKKKDEDAKRDAMMGEAGYLTLRWDCRDNHDAVAIRTRVFEGYKAWASKANS